MPFATDAIAVQLPQEYSVLYSFQQHLLNFVGSEIHSAEAPVLSWSSKLLSERLQTQPMCYHKTQVVHVNFTGLSLDPIQPGAASNESQLQPYYITVKAISGSGRSVIASSGGVYIDTTPPVFELIFHVDLSWSQSEPSTFQGDNSSIAVYYEVFDKESKVVETWWAIGSTPGGADVQPLVSIGTAAFAMNKSLEGLLLENQTYYVTLVSVNGAGLTTTNTSQGVTILTVQPSADNITTVTEDTEPFDKTSSSVPAVKTSRQDSVGVAWTKPPDEEHIDGVYLSVGSEDGKEDIYPEQQVGVGEVSGQATLSSGGLTFTGGNETIFSDASNGRQKRDLTGEFHMEPGRTLRINLRACSKAHICSQVPVKPILIVRDADTVAKTEGGQLIMTLENPAAPNSRIIVKAMEPQKDNTMLVGGFLSIDDVNSQYMSAASDTFKTFIVDPESTQDKTDRFLRNRLHSWEGQPVFISTLPDQTIAGPLSITMSFDKTREQDFERDIQPRILRWCADEEMWIDAGRTCDTDGGNSHIDWENGLLTVKVCHSSTVCNPEVKDGRGNRAVGDVVTTGVAEYAVVGVDATFSSSPPIIESDMKIYIDEDTHFEFTIRATDPDGDSLVFLLNPTAQSPRGNVTVSIDGKLSYTPCINCKGEDKIHFTVMEKRTDDVVSPLSVDGTLIVEIKDSNDVPIIQMFKEGRDIVPPSSAVKVTVEEDKDMFFVIAAHDVDLADDLAVAFESPRHGNLTVFNQIKKVDLIPHDCSQSWDTRRHLWDELVGDVTGYAAIQNVSLPNPCDTNFVNRHLSWVITAFQYAPFEHYFGEDTIKVTATDHISQDLLTIDVMVLRNDCVNISDPYCTSANRSEVLVAGEWGAWTMWSDCSELCGRGEQTRRRKCNDPPPMNGGRYCIGSSRETLQCTCDTDFNADAACTRLMAVGNHPGYFEDRCNCSRYYVCMRLETGWKAIRQSCPECLLWSSSSLTCGIIIDGCLFDVVNGTNNTASGGGGESNVTGIADNATTTTTSTVP
ncbi:hypothetical protein LSAT2_002238 [Lamellibrachia satsuma]|nr:hypothetical protein LSAT2_002238 [Lamellibrachia satsuma]